MSIIVKKLLKIIKDYEMPIGTQMNEKHIETWLSQFDEEDQDVILEEMINICKKFYFSREDVKNILEYFFTDKEYWETCTRNKFKNMKFLNIQERGTSQEDLLEIVNEVLDEKYQLNISECNSKNFYVYIDDCIFTGSRLKWDIERCIDDDIFKAGDTLVICHLFWYKSGSDYSIKKIKSMCHENSINLGYWYFDMQNNYQNNDYCNPMGTLWPQYIDDEVVNRYIALRGEVSEWAETAEFFRTYDMKKELIFSCSENRECVEKAFLLAGVDILDGLNNPCNSMRPMGFSKLETIGFGAVFITYRNIANNCPLALWYGDIFNQGNGPLGRWYPLFPRKCNEEINEDVDDDDIFNFGF
ncbi:hypothetical protein [uncultured Clostridium sp.]|uniref:phosphoribosyltransferase-like protein n=1 Tax=uncultured Clostridium sp. TaxID=59620 RepID=UPI002609B95E|nr:hypothetical protein [uncultured Clostridium sp.]